MMRLKNYQPVGNDLLLEARAVSRTRTGILLPDPQQDRVMRVVKTGPLVTVCQPGDFVLVGPDGRGLDVPFEGEDKKQILTVQVSEHAIIGLYAKEEDEDIVFMVGENTAEQEEMPGPKNIIDNPGIDKGSFLKENIIS